MRKYDFFFFLLREASLISLSLRGLLCQNALGMTCASASLVELREKVRRRPREKWMHANKLLFCTKNSYFKVRLSGPLRHYLADQGGGVGEGKS